MKSTAVRNGSKLERRISPKRLSKKVLADLSVLEDSPKAMSILRVNGASTGRKAVAAAKAAGVSIAYMKGNKIVKEAAAGNITVINPVFKRSSYFMTINPGTKFYAKK
jgi:hypothetical protein